MAVTDSRCILLVWHRQSASQIEALQRKLNVCSKTIPRSDIYPTDICALSLKLQVNSINYASLPPFFFKANNWEVLL